MTINTVSATPDVIKDCIMSLARNEELRKLAVYIHGPSGVGKSDLVREIATDLNWQLIDLRLTRMDSTDLSGLPYLHEESKQTIYYLPEFLPTEESIKAQGKDGCIVFLDELSAAEPRLQSTSYEFVLDRRIGKYKVPDNVMIIAAGNRVEDGCIAYELTAAISDRFIHFDVMTSVNSWLKWEQRRAKAGRPIVPAVKAFLQARPEFLDKGFGVISDNDDKINPSSRSWERVSNIMETVTDESLLKFILPGILGSATAHEFFFAVEELGSLAPMSEYIRLGLACDDAGIREILPTKITGLFGLSYSLPAYCKEENDFIGACHVLSVLSEIEDNLPRKELLVTSVTSLFVKAQQVDNKTLPFKIRASKAYAAMRKEHLLAWSDLPELDKKLNNDK